jgi:hypothetical protein
MTRLCLNIPPHPKSMLGEHEKRPATCKPNLSFILNTLKREREGTKAVSFVVER